MSKFYCYIDESGQHTLGKIFIVSIVLPFDREELETILLNIEKITRKNKVKWIKTQKIRKLQYIEQIFKLKNQVRFYLKKLRKEILKKFRQKIPPSPFGLGGATYF